MTDEKDPGESVFKDEGKGPHGRKDASKSAPQAPKAKEMSPRDLLLSGPKARTIVLVPEDLNEKRLAVEGLNELLKDVDKEDYPRFLTSINLNRLDGSFHIFTAVLGKTASARSREPKFTVSKGTVCGDYLTDGTVDDIGNDIDFGLQAEPVKVLDLPRIVDSIQRNVGPNYRVRFVDATVRLLNT